MILGRLLGPGLAVAIGCLLGFLGWDVRYTFAWGLALVIALVFDGATLGTRRGILFTGEDDRFGLAVALDIHACAFFFRAVTGRGR
jgi:hypothetical protein